MPMIVEPIVFKDDITIKIDEWGGVAFTLGERDHKGAQCVVEDERIQPTEIRTIQGIGTCLGNERARPQGCDRLNSEGGGCNEMSIVRRLTPMECERLQGFPDGWTDIGEWTDSKGKKRQTSDSARYKALGNSIALPYWKVLARRIAAQYDRDITMGSLFDGIGGFPLAFEHTGATPVWASEIEEFCIAVTRKRFGEKGADDGIHQ